MTQLIIIVLFSTIGLAGCAAVPSDSPRSDDGSPRIELLGFASCPNTPVMDQRLRSALDQIGVDVPVKPIDQEALADDDRRRGWPAPTVLVDGHDLFGQTPPQTPSLGCRMYAGPGGVPRVDELVQRLQQVGIHAGASDQ